MYEKIRKGAATSRIYQWSTIAHELGHLFGASHTGVKEQKGSITTEPERGQSILSYNGTRKFFSLHTIAQIWERLKKQPYYSNTEKTQIVDTYKMNDNIIYTDKLNIVYAKEQNIEVPVIDTETLETKNYQIPKGTYFSLFVPTKEKKDNFSYLAHPKTQVDPQFISMQASASQRIDFQEKYSYAGGFELGSKPTMKVGHYPITLAISNYDATKDVAPVYGTKDIEVEVVDSEPFKYIGGVGAIESAGKITTIRWQTGGTLFQDKKIRITMSDDYGKTFKYVLVDETENDGECEVILPYIKVDKKDVGFEEKLNPCLIRLDVIGSIAYAISNFSPRNQWGKFQGGFSLTKHVEFKNTPKTELNVKTLSEVPSDKGSVTAYVNGIEQDVIYETTPEKTFSDGSKLIRRIWKTEDKRFNFATKHYFAFEQKVYIGKKTNQDDETDNTITFVHRIENKNQELYPNPVKNILHIKRAKANKKVTIYSIDGRTLIEKQTDADGNLQINMQHLKNGLYIVKIDNKVWKIQKI